MTTPNASKLDALREARRAAVAAEAKQAEGGLKVTVSRPKRATADDVSEWLVACTRASAGAAVEVRTALRSCANWCLLEHRGDLSEATFVDGVRTALGADAIATTRVGQRILDGLVITRGAV